MRGGGGAATLKAFPTAGIKCRDGHLSRCRRVCVLRIESVSGRQDHDECESDLYRGVRHRESSMMNFTLASQSVDTIKLNFIRCGRLGLTRCGIRRTARDPLRNGWPKRQSDPSPMRMGRPSSSVRPAVAKARRLFKTGWQVHIVDADSRVFHPDKFDHLLRFPPKPATK